jgi:hypothetical protein
MKEWLIIAITAAGAVGTVVVIISINQWWTRRGLRKETQ